MKDKMTKKDYYNLIKEAMKDNADVIAFCDKEIAAIDNKAVKAKERAAKKAAEGDALMDAVYAALTDEAQIADAILAAIDVAEATVGKVQYRANKLVTEGKAEKAEVAVADANGKVTKRVGYKLAEQHKLGAICSFFIL